MSTELSSQFLSTSRRQPKRGDLIEKDGIVHLFHGTGWRELCPTNEERAEVALELSEGVSVHLTARAATTVLLMSKAFLPREQAEELGGVLHEMLANLIPDSPATLSVSPQNDGYWSDYRADSLLELKAQLEAGAPRLTFWDGKTLRSVEILGREVVINNVDDTV